MISNAFQCVFDQLFPVKSEASELIHSSNLPDVTSVISRSSLTKMPYMAAHSSCDSSSILMSTSCPPPPYCCESGMYTFDECGCCLECAKSELQPCGASAQIDGTGGGKCAKGLSCLKTCSK